MTTTLALSELTGFYILTGKGQLGYFDEKKTFVVDTALSQKFAGHITHFIQSYLKNPDEEGLRVAIVYQPQQARKWGSLTMVLTDAALRKLYPASHARVDELTYFQLQNHEKSIYRGIELFLDYHTDTEPDTPIFCPVCINRNTTLERYASNCHLDAEDTQAKSPVIEVVNLLGGIPVGRRNTPEIWELRNQIYGHAVRKELRKSLEMELLESARAHAPGSSRHDVSSNVYNTVDRRGEREVTLDGQRGNARMHRVVGNDKAVDPETLKSFEKFQALGFDLLSQLSEHCPVQVAPVGTPLFRRGSNDNQNFYLLEGTVQLEAKDGGTFQIEGGTQKARAEIAHLKPRMYTVTAVTPIKYLQIDAATETRILNTKSSGGFELV